MNHSWQTNSNSVAPGFVYFNVNNSYQHPNDTADFLAFGESSARKSPHNYHRFSPSNYSSPKFHRSPKNFSPRRPQYSGNHSKRSFNHSSSSSFNSQSSFNDRRHKKRNHNHFNKNDITLFYDPTCTKDPWEELELEAKQKEKAEQEANQDKSLTHEVSDEESSSSSSSEEESDDTVEKSDDKEDKSSNSSQEENM